MTTVLERVDAFVTRLSPEPVCDDCITERLGLTVRQHANHKTRELASQPGFRRERAVCSLCGEERIAIAKV